MKTIEKIRHSLSFDRFTTFYSIVALWPVLGFLPRIPSIFYYAVLIVYAFYCLTRLSSINKVLLPFVIYIPFQLLCTQPDPIFKSWERYFFLVLLFICIGPILSGDWQFRRRVAIFNMFLYMCVFIGVGSFFARFLGINYMRATPEYMNYASGLFGGITTHSMLLGPLSGIGAIFLTFIGFTKKNKLAWVLMLLCVCACMFAASRSALLATISAICVTIYKLSGGGGKFLKIILFISLMAAVSFQFWGSAMDGIIEKNEGNTSALEFSSREDKWLRRIIEFESNPLLGVGFMSVDKSMASADELNTESGGVESGTSWLIILSMTGIVGFALLLPLFYRCVHGLLKSDVPFGSVVLGCLTLQYIHMFAEGYIFAGGNVLCFSLWLTIAIAINIRQYHELQ